MARRGEYPIPSTARWRYEYRVEDGPWERTSYLRIVTVLGTRRAKRLTQGEVDVLDVTMDGVRKRFRRVPIDSP